jgi:diamine N-acetyltransferase
MNIQQVTPASIEKLRAFAEYTFRVAWEHMNDPADFEAYCRENFTAARLLAEMEVPGSIFYLVENDNELVAYIKLNINRIPEDWPEKEQAVQLERIYVAPGQQGKGIGKQLLDFTEKTAVDAGYPWVWLSVWQESPRSVAFYEQNGYTIFGTEVFVVGNDPQMDWTMKKRLFHDI